MAKITRQNTGFALMKDMRPVFLLTGTWESVEGRIGVAHIPRKEDLEQDGGGSFDMSYSTGAAPSRFLCPLSAAQFYNFVRGQFVFDGVQARFPQLIGFVPLERARGIVFFTATPVTRSERAKICAAVRGVYYSEYVFFCWSSQRPRTTQEAVARASQSLLRRLLPDGWEIARGDKAEIAEICPNDFDPLKVEYYE